MARPMSIKVGNVFETNNFGNVIVVSAENSRNIIVEFINTGTRVLADLSNLRGGRLKDPSIPSLIRGWGVLDIDYSRYTNEDNICPLVTDWVSMIDRCYNPVTKSKIPSYDNVKVCDEWKYFSNFRKWVLDVQGNYNWMLCELDKDLLMLNNKIYSPETAAYVSEMTNSFIRTKNFSRGDYMIGTSYEKSRGNFKANCSNPFSQKCENLGRYGTELEAHKAWQKRKHELACMLAESEVDPRVADALRQRYAPDKDWTKL